MRRLETVTNPNGFQYPVYCQRCVYRNSGVCSRICITCVKKALMDTPSKFEADCKKSVDDTASGQDLFSGER